MHPELKQLKQGMNTVLDDLERTIYAAARDVRALKRTACGEYSDAILYKNGFGTDTAEIYFFKFDPNYRRQTRSSQETLEAEMNLDYAHKKVRYIRWAKGIKAVQRIVAKYYGEVRVENMPLDEYLTSVDARAVPDHRIHVSIHLHEQDKLRKLREIASEKYRSLQS